MGTSTASASIPGAAHPRDRRVGELLAALEELLSELIPAMKIRGHESAPIREMD
jgi:hypothetical protein